MQDALGLLQSALKFLSVVSRLQFDASKREVCLRHLQRFCFLIDQGNLPIELPQFNVVPVNELFGGFNCCRIVRAIRKGYRALKVAFGGHKIEPVLRHGMLRGEGGSTTELAVTDRAIMQRGDDSKYVFRSIIQGDHAAVRQLANLTIIKMAAPPGGSAAFINRRLGNARFTSSFPYCPRKASRPLTSPSSGRSWTWSRWTCRKYCYSWSPCP